MNKNKKKKLTKFYKIFFSIIIILMILTIVGFVYLWISLNKYEKSTEEYGLRISKEYVLSDNYDKLTKLTNIKINEFEDKFEIYNILSNYIGNKIEYSKDLKESNSEYKIYKIKNEDNIVGIVKLVSKNKEYLPTEINYNYKTSKLELIVPQNFKILINNKEVGSEYITKKDVVYDELSRLSENIVKPLQVKYEINDFYYEPEIKILDEFDNAIDTIITNKDNVKTVVSYNKKYILEEDKSVIEKMIREDSELYSNYMSKDATLGMISKRIKRDSEIYKNMKDVEIVWYNDHEKQVIRDYELKSMNFYSKDLFKTEVDYNYVVTKNRKEYVYETKLSLIYYKENNKWWIGDIVLRGE